MQTMQFAVQAFTLHLLASLVLPGLAIHVSLEREPLASISKSEVPVSLLRGGVSTALEAFAVAEADSEVGSDLGLDLGLEQDSSRGTADPATLAEYCAGPKDSGMAKGTRVKADWNDYGTMYPGKISAKNKDGTVDIAYDDGFTEKGVNPDDVEVRKKQGKANFAQLALTKPLNDPACKLQEFLKKVQDQLKDLNGMITEWLSGQRAKIASKDAPPPPPKVATPPPTSKAQGNVSTAAPTTDQAGELEKLKGQLSELDAYIKELEAEEKKYDKKLEAKHNPDGAPAAAPGVKTVDDLIAEYVAKIAQRNARVQELLQRIKEQKEELARLGEGQLSLKDIDDALKKLEQDVEEGQRKRDELKKAGELDPELRAIIDDIIKAISKTRKKVDNLLGLEAKAKAEKAKAEQDAKEAAEAARRKAKEEGRDEDEAASEAAAAAKKKADERARKADLETMEAAHEVEKDLKDAEKGATKLDTGLHPHGERWWRYRYEHSYIESILMIFISFLMLAWSLFWHKIAQFIPGHHHGKKQVASLGEEEQSHGEAYALWLHWLAEQMLVCICVFLTLWLIAKTHIVEVFPVIITPSAGMHVPHGPQAAAEYRTLALDICTIFFLGIVFYFGLMFSLAHEMKKTMAEMDRLEATSSQEEQRDEGKSLAVFAMGHVCRNKEKYDLLHDNFAKVMNETTELFKDNTDLQEVSELVRGDFANLQLTKYLQVNIRAGGVVMFKFGLPMWLPTMLMFVVCMLAHRFAHIGYIRIMCGFGLAVIGMIAYMAYYTKTVIHNLHEQTDGDEATPRNQIHDYTNTSPAAVWLNMLQFCLFFVCYGVARMVCQPWMWELHFWLVLSQSIVAVVGAALFVCIVSPGIPSFIAAMAMPPYVDSGNMKMMKNLVINANKPSKIKSTVA